MDVQATFSPPQWLVSGIEALATRDRSLVAVGRVFVKHGYAQTPEAIAHIRSLSMDRVLVCSIQTDTCVLAAGFALFDAGLAPTLVTNLTVGSSLDRSGQLGIRLWRHHFRRTATAAEISAALDGQH